MRLILLGQPGHTADLQFIVAENIRRDLYRQREGDGPHPSANQIGARVRRYRDWFKSAGHGIVRCVGP
jgi:hypothetical protein